MERVTLTIPEDCDVTAAEVWLAAVAAAPSPPLFASLATAALAGGWPRDGRWSEHDAHQIIGVAISLADAAGAPAGDRISDTGTYYDPDRVGPPGLTYTTVTETAVSLAGRTLTITGGPLSVLRRMLAAAEVAELPVDLVEGHVMAAVAETRERAAEGAALALLSAIAKARNRGLRYVADEDESAA